MIKLLVQKIPRITKNRKKLETALKIKITNRGKEVFLDGEPEQEFAAEKVVLALDFGFPYEDALRLKDGETIFETINIKEHTKRTDLARIRARIIGKGGKILSTLANLTECDFELKDNFVGVIGNPERIEAATEGIISIIHGSKIGNVYSRLERSHPKDPIDLGLKE